MGVFVVQVITLKRIRPFINYRYGIHLDVYYDSNIFDQLDNATKFFSS